MRLQITEILEGLQLMTSPYPKNSLFSFHPFYIHLPVFIQSHTSIVLDICIEYDMVNYKPS